MHVCVCVCARIVCMYICVCACMHVRVHALYACVCMCVHVCMCVGEKIL